MVNALRRLAAFCLCIALSLGVLTPAASRADSIKPDDLAVIRRQAEAFVSTEQRLPELAKLVSDGNWTFTRNLIHGPIRSGTRNAVHQPAPQQNGP